MSSIGNNKERSMLLVDRDAAAEFIKERILSGKKLLQMAWIRKRDQKIKDLAFYWKRNCPDNFPGVMILENETEVRVFTCKLVFI